MVKKFDWTYPTIMAHRWFDHKPCISMPVLWLISLNWSVARRTSGFLSQLLWALKNHCQSKDRLVIGLKIAIVIFLLPGWWWFRSLRAALVVFYGLVDAYGCALQLRLLLCRVWQFIGPCLTSWWPPLSPFYAFYWIRSASGNEFVLWMAFAGELFPWRGF